MLKSLFITAAHISYLLMVYVSAEFRYPLRSFSLTRHFKSNEYTLKNYLHFLLTSLRSPYFQPRFAYCWTLLGPRFASTNCFLLFVLCRDSNVSEIYTSFGYSGSPLHYLYSLFIKIVFPDIQFNSSSVWRTFWNGNIILKYEIFLFAVVNSSWSWFKFIILRISLYTYILRFDFAYSINTMIYVTSIVCFCAV